uniref:Uncharacterized protein n=1 Tax=Tanacetum cinerariifolium TaxID=118510 RepID=A0A699GS94_TANCI|nr:hypothetical protein [Tanacetum cinerariifolium]
MLKAFCYGRSVVIAGRKNNHRKKTDTVTSSGLVIESNGTLNDATLLVAFVKKEVVLQSVDETVVKDKQTPTSLGSIPPLPTHETPLAGNTPNNSSFMEGLNAMLKNGSWFIRNNPLILKKWRPYVNLLKEDVGTIPVWVKLHGVPVMKFSEEGLSAIATKLGTPLMLDSYTCDMCMQSWGRSSYARAMIKLRADVELRDNSVAAMPKITREGYHTCNIRVEYEWKLPRFACCKVFGHTHKECPKNIGTGEMKNLKKTSQTSKGFLVGQNIVYKPTKQVYQPVSKKSTANISVNKMKNVDPLKENVDASSPSTTPVIEKIDKIGKLIIEGKVTLVDDDGKPLEKVDSSYNYDSEDEVASVDNDMDKFLANKDGYGTQSLLEQWTESYKNGDYGYDPYDNDMYEGQDIIEPL